MAVKSPLAVVKETFGEKAKLVAALEKLTGEDLWMPRTNSNKGLAHVSNAKLLRLHAIFEVVKEKFSTREKLVDSILDLEKRSKDAAFREKLLSWPVPRLYDAYRSAAKRLRRESPSPGQPKTEQKAAVRGTGASKKAAPKAEAKAKAKPASSTAKKASPKKGAKG